MLGSQPYMPNAENVNRINLAELAGREDAVGKEVIFRASEENARVQSAKLAFLVFRQGLASNHHPAFGSAREETLHRREGRRTITHASRRRGEAYPSRR